MKQRTIKFRAWDGKYMMFWDVFKRFEDNIYYQIWSGEMKVMQYTGLKDKNGKEIYEGDLVVHYVTKDNPEVVEWDKLMWRPFWFDTEFGNPSTDMIVVGNIHENKGLLNGKKD